MHAITHVFYLFDECFIFDILQWPRRIPFVQMVPLCRIIHYRKYATKCLSWSTITSGYVLLLCSSSLQNLHSTSCLILQTEIMQFVDKYVDDSMGRFIEWFDCIVGMFCMWVRKCWVWCRFTSDMVMQRGHDNSHKAAHLCIPLLSMVMNFFDRFFEKAANHLAEKSREQVKNKRTEGRNLRCFNFETVNNLLTVRQRLLLAEGTTIWFARLVCTSSCLIDIDSVACTPQ